MSAREMYPELYKDHLTGDPAYDKAFAALADCPSFAQVEQALRTYAHELAEEIRQHCRNSTDPCGCPGADLIDPERESNA